MVHCPKCGSGSITLKRETNVNWGRAMAGYLLFGVVGGAVGAVTGSDRNVNACLNCGTTWRAEELYQALQLIEQASGREFDLSTSTDRNYLSDFLIELEELVE